ncbi:hypothetical protein ABTA67_20085, partial [Acinetobacter baumannii]
AYTDHTDCTGRMTRAMAVFSAGAIERRQRLADDSGLVVNELGAALDRLANADIGHTITVPFPAAQEPLRHQFNTAIANLRETMSEVS